MFEDTIKAIRQWFEPEPELPDVDVEYVADRSYKYLQTDIEHQQTGDRMVRCNLCGRLFKIERTQEAFDHIGEHDMTGQADIDPFDRSSERPSEPMRL